MPTRRGNAHPNIVPYQLFETADDPLILAVGNDGQFSRFCEFAGIPEIAENPLYQTNSNRVANRDALIEILIPIVKTKPRQHWLDGLEGLGVPASPVNDIAQVFDDPQIKHRKMKVAVPHDTAAAGSVDLIANPIKMSETPVSYRYAPPTLGQHTNEVLKELLGLSDDQLKVLHADGLIS